MKLTTHFSRAAIVCVLFATPALAAKTSGWAVVNDDGSLARGDQVATSEQLGTGTYEVDFTHSVKTCVFTGTIGLSGSSGSSPEGFITLAGRGGTPNGVYIKTFDKHGDSTDLGFHLNVRCASQGPSFTAVVDPTGLAVRGRGMTGASLVSAGSYQVDFNKDVTACAYTAAVGLPGDAGGSAPGAITVVGRSGQKKSIFVRIYDTSHALADLGFHVVVSC